MKLSCRYVIRLLTLVLLVAFVPVSTLPQASRRIPLRTARPLRTQVLENNVRAQLEFLASDAMQGRGSGTGFERIAAEYIGSQFRQFGLEPAGDIDPTGSQSFVQKVSME